MKFYGLSIPIIYLLILISNFGFGQNVIGLPVVQNYTPQEYGAHRQNWQIAQASNGMLYFANGKGLLSFNGEDWDLTLMPNRGHVRSLAVDEKGTVFVGANNNFGKLVTNSSGERKFQSFLPQIDSFDHNFGRIRKTISTKDGVYFQAYHRIFRIFGNTIKTWRFSTTCYRIFYVHNKLYAIDLDRGLLVLKDDEFVSAKQGSFLKQTRVSILLPFEEKMLIGTRDKGLFLYNHHQFTPFKTDADHVFREFGLYEGLISNDDKIVLSTHSNDGIYVLDKNGITQSTINQNTGLVSGNVLSIFEDKQFSFWVGLQEGIARVDFDSPYSVFDDRIGLEGTIQSITDFGGEIYAASSEGLIKLGSGPINTISEVGNINSYCWDLESWNDQLIIASTNGAYSLQGNKMLSLQSRANFVSAISRSVHDSLAILLALDDGLSYQRWNGVEWTEVGRIEGISGAVREVLEDGKGVFWLKTRSNGLFKITIPLQGPYLNFDEFHIHHFDHQKGVPQGENNIFKIDENLLVRSEEDSIYIFDRSVDRFVSALSWRNRFGLEEGLVLPKSNAQQGVLWLDYFVDGKKWLLKAEKKPDGIYSIEKFPFSSKMLNFKDPYGNEVFFSNENHLWFGGMKGILQADLDQLVANSEELPLLITEVHSTKEPVFILGTDLDKKEIGFQNNDLSFKFSSPFYQDKEYLQYAVYLDGYDNGWSTWSDQSEKNYTNLPSGKYTFQVKAKNDFDNLSEVMKFSFTIHPPWFVSPWAIIVYFLLAGILIWGIIYLRSAKLRKEQLRLEKLVHERTEEIKKQAEEINELYEVKNRFLANISHELRTPLTLILGPVEQLLSAITENTQKKQLTWVHQNSKKLLKLINQLLDLSKIEAGKLELQTKQQDLVKFCKYICSAFESLAKQKKVNLIFESSMDQLEVFFDAEKMEQVLNNLLNNALKFTEKGQVKVTIEMAENVQESFAKITVQDSGIGIRDKQLPYIFDRFYQADQGEDTFYKGTGIGLALCKELVELHSGRIEASSVIGKGTTISIFLPFEKSFIENEPSIIGVDDAPEQSAEIKVVTQMADDEGLLNEAPLILIVDDNEDIIDYIQIQLGKQFQFLKAFDGLEGFQIAAKELPDLIVSDVMMPGIDGFELCSKLKNDIKTDHIPVILLTARVGEEDKMRGLQNQADDYLQKPFNSKELELRIQNLIDNRKKLRKRFAERIIFQPEEIAENPQEALFLQHLMDSMEKHIDDMQFDVNQMSKLLGMSKSQLNRKMKAVLNKSPNQFIRSYRLEKAHQLIKVGQLTISEIAYDVGFSSPAYFSKCFHDEFGYPPSSLTEQN